MSGGWTFITLLIMTTMLFVINNPSSVLAKLLSAHWLVVIGSMSYSLYLWHPPAFGLIDMIFVKWDHSWLWLAKICMRFALAFLLGALSYHFTEKAALKWRKAVSNG
jgi:peptidoglycan/LPS O-acetylase OafA/YrhL